MLERHILASRTDAPGHEPPAATRDRLKARFPAGAARRMTQLGMLVGAVLGDLAPAGDDAIFYASEFGESLTLGAFLESFPNASPTMFQTSVHPSGVQQGLIGRQRSVPELFPFAGSGCIVMHALLGAMLSPARRALVCGGEERGTWLRELGVASEETYAYALALGREETADAAGRIVLTPDAGAAQVLSPAAWFELLHKKLPHDGPLGPGWRLRLTWKTP